MAVHLVMIHCYCPMCDVTGTLVCFTRRTEVSIIKTRRLSASTDLTPRYADSSVGQDYMNFCVVLLCIILSFPIGKIVDSHLQNPSV